MLTEKGTFPEGLIIDGQLYTEFALEEEIMRHTFEVAHDSNIDDNQLDDPCYYAAALLTKRLKVEGLKTLSVDQVLEMSGADGRATQMASMRLENRRLIFRKEIKAASDGHSGAEKTGLHDGGSPGHEPG